MLKKNVHYDISVTLRHILYIVHDHIRRWGKTREDSFRMVVISEERIYWGGEGGGGQTIKFSLKVFITYHIWTDSTKLFYRPV